MKSYKQPHNSWKRKADTIFKIQHDHDVYLRGVNDFRDKALEALEHFSAITIDQPVLVGNKIYVSQEDVIRLIEGLYAETKMTKMTKIKK